MILETLPNGADYIDVARDPSFGRPDARQGLQQDFPLAIEPSFFRMRDGIRVGLNICFDLF